MQSVRNRLIRFVEAHGIVSARDVEREGIHTELLTRLRREGVLERIARGKYRMAGQLVSEHYGLVLATAAAPKGVICLLSALAFHGVGTQMPDEVWIALKRGSWRPDVAYPPIRVMQFSTTSFVTGLEHYVIEGQQVPVYNLAKTIADCFKFRNKIGIDVALEALTDGWQAGRFTMADITEYGRVCRVLSVMNPYLEMLVA